MLNAVLWSVIGVCVFALVVASLKKKQILKRSAGNPKQVQIGGFVRSAAQTFLKKEYWAIAKVAAPVAIILGVSAYFDPESHWFMGVAMLIGCFISALAGERAMDIATLANNRTAWAAQQEGMSGAFKVSFGAGGVASQTVHALGLLGLAIIILGLSLFTNWDMTLILNVVIGYSFGASLVAFFARVGGGVFTKAADVAADSAADELGIEEDDVRNAGGIADGAGDNVGDTAGMSADLLESNVGSIIGSMILAMAVGAGFKAAGSDPLLPVLLTFAISGVGLMVSILALQMVKVNKDASEHDVHKTLNIYAFGTTGVMTLIIGALLFVIMPKGWDVGTEHYTALGLFVCIVIGLFIGPVIGAISEAYTSTDSKYAKLLVEKSKSGVPMNVITSLSVGMESSMPIALLVAISMIVVYWLGGFFGIAVAAATMLSLLTVHLSIDTYGPIADTAQGSSEMGGLDPKAKEICNKLDSVGNTTAATGKGLAIASAVFTAVTFFLAFMDKAGISVTDVNLGDVYVLAGLAIGAMLAFKFAGIANLKVSEAAADLFQIVVKEFHRVRRGETEHPDYNKCIEICTDTALSSLKKPGALAIGSVLIAGVIDPRLEAGILAGVLFTGFVLAITLANAGGLADNGKKLANTMLKAAIKAGKPEEEIKVLKKAVSAAILGDTVGDPLKDTSGPSLNILMKLMGIAALAFAGLTTGLNEVLVSVLTSIGDQLPWLSTLF